MKREEIAAAAMKGHVEKLSDGALKLLDGLFDESDHSTTQSSCLSGADCDSCRAIAVI